jgi:hypothetical protein
MHMNIYDYKNQAWIEDGRYVRCGHSDSMHCDCYGKLHEGELATQETIEREGPAIRPSLKAAINYAVRGYGEGRNMSYRESMIDAGRGHLLRGDE